MIQVVAKATVKEEMKESYLEKAFELIESTRNEEGCLSYELFQDIKDPGIFTFIEKWEDMDHLERHFNTEHFRRIVPLLKDMRLSSDLNIYSLVK